MGAGEGRLGDSGAEGVVASVRIPLSLVSLKDAVEGIWACIIYKSFPLRGAWVMGCHGAMAHSSGSGSWESEGGRTRVRSPELENVLGRGQGASARAPTVK